MSPTHKALSRALSSWIGRGARDLQQLFDAMAFEMGSIMSNDLPALALMIKLDGDSYLMGRSEENLVLPAETLLGLLTDEATATPCRVRDHALDAVRFIDTRFRSSVLAAIVIPSTLLRSSGGCLWFGLSGCATPQAISKAESMARDVSDWLEWYSSAIEASMRCAQERDVMRGKIKETISVIHDARAPLGALKYFIQTSPNDMPEDASPLRELEYLEKLLSLCAPSRYGESPSLCDVSHVLTRVCSRYERQQLKGRIFWERTGKPMYARIGELELERIISNVFSNSVRYAAGARVDVVVARKEHHIAISISDDGPGIPRETLLNLQEGRALPCGFDSGWGIGLQRSRERVLSAGGEFLITSRSGEGTGVVIHLEALSENNHMTPSTCVADASPGSLGLYGHGSIFIVDDDVEHAQSLARILAAAGNQVIACESLQALLARGELSPRSIVICDARMPDGGAEELLRVFGRRERVPTVGVMSGDGSEALLYRLAALGAQAFFTKPVDCAELTTWIRQHSVGAET